MTTAKIFAGIGVVTGAIVAIWYFRKKTKLPCGPHGYGDINDDGVVDEYDVMWAQQIVDGLLQPTHDAFKRADVDGDGVVTQTDVGLIQDYVSGVIDTFPVC